MPEEEKKTEEPKTKSESKGSNLIQLKVSDKVKKYLHYKAERLGFPLNTYVYHLIMKQMEEDEK